MKLTLSTVCMISLLIFFTGCGTEPEAVNQEDEPSIKGVWSIESMDVGDGETRRTTAPPAFMMFITDKHYSAIRDFTPEPQEGAPASARSFMADAGTYEFDGNELVVHHKVAMFPTLGSMTFGCVLEDATTLILTPQYDKMDMPGMNMKPSPAGKMGYGDRAVLYRFKRLE
jgi:hypothetical protein